MTDSEHDPKVSQRYRELGAEEPPREMDAAILAAARREVAARPAPLVAPTARRRWYFPVAAAAIIMLSVAVTLQMQHEQPDMEAQAPRAQKPAQPPPETPVPEPAAAPPVAKPQERPLAARPGAAQRGTVIGAEQPKPAGEHRRFTPDPPPVASPAPAAAPPAPRADDAAGASASARDRTERLSAQEARANRAEVAAETPERWLERIAEMRRQGRHKEADEQLAEFKRRHPDYRIPEAMLEKVLAPR